MFFRNIGLVVLRDSVTFHLMRTVEPVAPPWISGPPLLPPGPNIGPSFLVRITAQVEHCCWAPTGAADAVLTAAPRSHVVEQPAQFLASWHLGQPALHGSQVLCGSGGGATELGGGTDWSLRSP